MEDLTGGLMSLNLKNVGKPTGMVVRIQASAVNGDTVDLLPVALVTMKASMRSASTAWALKMCVSNCGMVSWIGDFAARESKAEGKLALTSCLACGLEWRK